MSDSDNPLAVKAAINIIALNEDGAQGITVTRDDLIKGHTNNEGTARFVKNLIREGEHASIDVYHVEPNLLGSEHIAVFTCDCGNHRYIAPLQPDENDESGYLPMAGKLGLAVMATMTQVRGTVADVFGQFGYTLPTEA